MRIYTRRGDDGTTALRAGGRVDKDHPSIEALGALDEAQAALGSARASCPGELDAVLVALERDLWVLMAEVATAVGARLEPGRTAVTAEMVERLEREIDAGAANLEEITDFTVPGESACAAALDVARTVVRRAERRLAACELSDASSARAYVNRLSDLCWILARSCERTHRFASEAGGDER